jgi:hypothetical protein
VEAAGFFNEGGEPGVAWPCFYGDGDGEGGFGANDETAGGQRVRKVLEEDFELGVGGKFLKFGVGVNVGLEEVDGFGGLGLGGLVEVG